MDPLGTPLLVTTLAVLGGFLSLDATGLGQVMVSRPLVSGALAGWILGDAGTGLAVGAVLEVALLPEVPVGGGGVPEGWLGGLAAAAWSLALPPTVAGGAGAVLVGLAWALLGGWTVPVLRRWNVRLLPDPEHPRPEAALERAHRTTMALDFLRGAGLAALGVGSAFLVPGARVPGSPGASGGSAAPAGWAGGLPWTDAGPAAPGSLSVGGVAAAGLLLLAAVLVGTAFGAVAARSGRGRGVAVRLALGAAVGVAGAVGLAGAAGGWAS